MHSTTHLGFYSRALVKQWRLPWLAEMHRQPDSVACNTQNMQVYDTRLIVNSTSYVYNHTYTYIGNSFTGHYPSSSSSPESTGGLIISHTSPRKPPWAATTVFLQVKCSTNSVTFKSELCTAFAHCAKLQLQIINLNTPSAALHRNAAIFLTRPSFWPYLSLIKISWWYLKQFKHYPQMDIT